MALASDMGQLPTEVPKLLRAMGDLLIAMSPGETSRNEPSAPWVMTTETVGDDEVLDQMRNRIGELRSEIGLLYKRLDGIESGLCEHELSEVDGSETISDSDVVSQPPWANSEEPPPPDLPIAEPCLSDLLNNGPATFPENPSDEVFEKQIGLEQSFVESFSASYINGICNDEIQFSPEDGSVLIIVAPVAGFQGLLQMQDVLVHVTGIRDVGVEAYAQGEARLRLHLDAPMAVSRLAVTLGEILGVTTQVSEASEQDRSLRLALG
jgi:hypothetical protein